MSRNGYAKPYDVIVTVPIDRELHRDLKVVAASRGLSIKWLLTNAIKGIVIQHDQRENG
jgi:hypothetical protein